MATTNNNNDHFTTITKEDAKLNQYWYSPNTIATIVNEVMQLKRENENIRVACISTPSVYFSLPDKANCFLFDVCLFFFDFFNSLYSFFSLFLTLYYYSMILSGVQIKDLKNMTLLIQKISSFFSFFPFILSFFD